MPDPKTTSIRKRILIGTASNYAGQLIAFATLFFLTPFILQRLGDEAYGLWVLVGSLVAYGSLLDFGIWGALIKYVAEYRARQEQAQARRLIATAFRFYLLLGLALALIFAALAPLFPRLFEVSPALQRSAPTIVLLMGLGVGVSLPAMTYMSVLRGLQRYDLVNLIEAGVTLLTALATVAVLLLGAGLVGLVLVNIAGVLLMLFFSLLTVRRIAPELLFGWRDADRSALRTVLGYSWPLFVRDVASRLQTRTDEITIGAFLPVAAVAPYNLARRLSEVTHILTKQFMKVLLPLASELHAERDMGRLRGVYLAGSRLTLLIALGVAVPLIALARPLLTAWVGPEYAGAAPLVGILAVASLISTLQWPAGAVLQGLARHRPLAYTALIAGLANLALSIALVRPFGPVGVALGTLIPALIELAVVLPYTLRALEIPYGQALRAVLLPVLAPAALMAVTILSLRALVAPQMAGLERLPFLFVTLGLAAAGLLAHALGYVLLGATPEERRTLKKLLALRFQLRA